MAYLPPRKQAASPMNRKVLRRAATTKGEAKRSRGVHVVVW